ncbi:MAG: hypothetical protein QG656_523, partial [Candidatus Hydrogenedentes bacterium]|nr:hypothetical protein [Candidatus Hydrogenedentota bacterium]
VPETVNFGQLAQAEAATEKVPVSNVGTGLLQGTATLEGDPLFTIVPGTGTVNVLAGRSQDVIIAFVSPGPNVKVDATLTITWKDGDGKEVKTEVAIHAGPTGGCQFGTLANGAPLPPAPLKSMAGELVLLLGVSAILMAADAKKKRGFVMSR